MKRLLFTLSTTCSILVALQLQAQQRVSIGLKDGNGVFPVIENGTGTVVGTIPLGMMPQERIGRARDLIRNATGTLSVADPNGRLLAKINVRAAIGSVTASTTAEMTPAIRASVIGAPDGIGVVDTATGLEWLPFSYSLGLSYEVAVASPRASIPAGYGLATDSEVLQLLRDFGFPSLPPDTIVTMPEDGTLARAFFALFGTSDRDYQLSTGLSKPDFTISPCDSKCMAGNLSVTIVYGPLVISANRPGSALLHAPEYLGLDPSTGVAYAYYLVRRPLGNATTWVKAPSFPGPKLSDLPRSLPSPNDPSGYRATALNEMGIRIRDSGLPKSISDNLLATIASALNSMHSGDSKGLTHQLAALQQRLTSLGPGGIPKEESDIIAKIAAQLQQLLQ